MAGALPRRINPERPAVSLQPFRACCPLAATPGEALLTRPMKTETVPTWILAVSNIAHLLVLSALELLLAPSFHRTGTSAWQSSLLLLVDGAVINAVVYSVVSVIKRSVGRLRPDYFARLAAGDESAINQGTLSYPSGHAALAATCGAYWALHLTWTLYYRNRQGSAPLPRVLRWQGDLKAFGKIVLVGLGPAVAGFISVSRVIDNRHHPSDINAGALIGIVATILLWAQTRVPAASRERMAAEEAKGGGQV